MEIRKILSDAADSGNSMTRFKEVLCECDNPECRKIFSVPEGLSTDYCSEECAVACGDEDGDDYLRLL